MRTHHDISSTMQDYLKLLYNLGEELGSVTNSALSEALAISPASVSGMVRKLAEKECVSYTPYREIRLTEKGKVIALEIVRHHRILETFLVTVLGMRWDEVHDEAERLEHVISEHLEASMARMMGHPTHDPHGHPIPDLQGTVAQREGLDTLRDVAEGERVRVCEVSDTDSEALRYLGDQGVRIGSRVLVERIHPFDGPIEIRIDDQRRVLGRYLAGMVRVEMEES